VLSPFRNIKAGLRRKNRLAAWTISGVATLRSILSFQIATEAHPELSATLHIFEHFRFHFGAHRSQSLFVEAGIAHFSSRVLLQVKA
jgi:hypothetical protein